jgi:ligand-binding sensor domain-containing protein/signal transduction histidine kinase
LQKNCKNYELTFSILFPTLLLVKMRFLVINPLLVFKWLESMLLLFLLCLATHYSEAQSPPVVFRNFSVNDGLSHNFVRGIFQDSRGFIWISTIDGLNKFDGYTFKTYKSRNNDTTSLSSNNISDALVEDNYGNIWLGTWGGGICIYNRKSDSFKRIRHSTRVQENTGFPSKFVYVLHKDTKNRIWVGTSDQGLILADPDKLIFTQFAHDPANPSSLSHNGIQSITEDDKGNLWIGTLGGGLNYFNPETKKFIHYKHQDSDQQSPANDVVTSVFFDSKKRLWIATTNNTLSLMKNQPGKFIHFKHHPDDPKSIGDFHITCIAENNNKIWIGSDFGLMIYDEANNNFHDYNSRPFDRKALSSNQIKVMCSDRQGRLWIGTYNGGLSMFDKSFVKVLHYYTFLNENSLSFNDVSAFLQNDDGTILVGTDGGGLNTFDRKIGKFTHYRNDPSNTLSLGGNNIKSILKDKNGRIWMGLWGKGVNIFDQENKIFIPFKNKGRRDDNLTDDNVTCLTQDADGFIWACTWGSGVFKFNPDKSSLENFVFDRNDTTSLSNFNAWAIYADSKNNIWVGNSDGVLDLYNRESGGFIHFNTTSPGENSTGILVLFEDSNGRLWIGLEGGGLKLLDKERGTFKSYGTETGLPSDYVNSIEEDRHGYLWIGTNNGISRFDPETGKTKNYGLNYGLQSLQFNRQSSLKLTSGEMMFGGVNGFNIFHPDSLVENSQDFPIAFTDFQIFNKPVSIGKRGSPLKEHINETSEIKLPYNQSIFSLEYAALNFMGPENIQYRYRLKGFVNEDWQNVGVDRKVTYTNLDPGTYTFQVNAADGDGLWNEKAASLVIQILPPWWKTWWFRAAASLLVAGSAVAYYKMRVHTIKQRTKKLEMLVAKRTEELQHTNEELLQRDDEILAQNNALMNQREELASQNEELQTAQETIEQQNEEIRRRNETLEEEVKERTKDLVEYNQQLEQFAFISAHNLRGPVARILGLGNLLEMMKSEPADEYQIVNKLVASTQELDTVVRDLNTIVGLRKDNISTLTDVNLEKELRSIKINLEKEILETEAVIQEDFSKAPCIHTIKPYLDSIFVNLISNAIKYRHPDRHPIIQIKSDVIENYICVAVRDNGLGINLAACKGKLFMLYSRFHNHVEGKGMGLYVVKTQVASLGGRIEVESEIDCGTTFRVFFKKAISGQYSANGV